MAPEVALSEPYGLSADIYSFGILLWEIIALKKAYGRMDVDQHRKLVVQGEERPEMDQTWSSCLQGILKGCWDRYPIQRPEAKDVHSMLRKEMNEMLIRNFPIHPTSDD